MKYFQIRDKNNLKEINMNIHLDKRLGLTKMLQHNRPRVKLLFNANNSW